MFRDDPYPLALRSIRALACAAALAALACDATGSSVYGAYPDLPAPAEDILVASPRAQRRSLGTDGGRTAADTSSRDSSSRPPAPPPIPTGAADVWTSAVDAGVGGVTEPDSATAPPIDAGAPVDAAPPRAPDHRASPPEVAPAVDEPVACPEAGLPLGGEERCTLETPRGICRGARRCTVRGLGACTLVEHVDPDCVPGDDGPPLDEGDSDDDLADSTPDPCLGDPGRTIERPAGSCAAIKAACDGSPSGVYWVDAPRAAAAQPLQVYCEMTSASGGWTLVWKQAGFARNHVALDPELADTEPLLSADFDESTWGSLLGYFPYEEMLFWHDAFVWVQVADTLDTWTPDRDGSPHRCRHLERVAHECEGIDCAEYSYVHLRLEPDDQQAFTGLIIGAHGGGSPGIDLECGRTWCTGLKHGGYWGGCYAGDYGHGDWAIFVR